MEIVIGLLIPFIGTVLGSFMVYFLKNKLNKKFEIIILGFAAGVMVAASIWSLIIPAMEMVQNLKWLPVSIGLIFGILIFWLVDYFMQKRKVEEIAIEEQDYKKLMLAVTLHNIPEGMAVGVVLASLLTESSIVSLASCYALCLGIAIQNFPEGVIVSFPMYKSGYSRGKAFLYGVISALFELLGSIITLLFTKIITMILPYLLAVAAGAMLYVVVVELIPGSRSKNNLNVIGFLIGFMIMMILDVSLG